VSLQPVSTFRSVERQAEIIRGKLARGQAIKDIIKVSAPPGYSEHHTGCAVDVGTTDSPALDVVFEQTAAFSWLSSNAESFDFHLSYPRGNPYNYDYEPWHWRFGGEP
jgi:D-alanyl-D-alanine carboxypeptidase